MSADPANGTRTANPNSSGLTDTCCTRTRTASPPATKLCSLGWQATGVRLEIGAGLAPALSHDTGGDGEHCIGRNRQTIPLHLIFMKQMARPQDLRGSYRCRDDDRTFLVWHSAKDMAPAACVVAALPILPLCVPSPSGLNI
jgi:hypothetical protein